MRQSTTSPLFLLALSLFLMLGTACGPTETIDSRLQAVITAQAIKPLSPPPPQNEAQVRLGQFLFFDKILSGNKDISCATCHHPTQNTGDSLPVSIGTGGKGLGLLRQVGYGRDLIPRNAPEVFNRGAPEWQTMFWDSRVTLAEDGSFISPAGNRLPDGLSGVLAVQAMFPVTSRAEMRGSQADQTIEGDPNELAAFNDLNFPGIWRALSRRLLTYPEYRQLFSEAYPDIALEDIGFEQAANALAAFEIDAYALPNSPWQQYLRGDKYAFRTPSLHNVAVTVPWMHDGAFSTLAATVQHHLDPETSLKTYDPLLHLPPPMQDTFQNDPALLDDMLRHIDPDLALSRKLTPTEVNNLLAFLEALTDPDMGNLYLVTPDNVPSNLPVSD